MLFSARYISQVLFIYKSSYSYHDKSFLSEVNSSHTEKKKKNE